MIIAVDPIIPNTIVEVPVDDPQCALFREISDSSYCPSFRQPLMSAFKTAMDSCLVYIREPEYITGFSFGGVSVTGGEMVVVTKNYTCYYRQKRSLWEFLHSPEGSRYFSDANANQWKCFDEAYPNNDQWILICAANGSVNKGCIRYTCELTEAGIQTPLMHEDDRRPFPTYDMTQTIIIDSKLKRRAPLHVCFSEYTQVQACKPDIDPIGLLYDKEIQKVASDGHYQMGFKYYSPMELSEKRTLMLQLMMHNLIMQESRGLIMAPTSFISMDETLFGNMITEYTNVNTVMGTVTVIKLDFSTPTNRDVRL
jgi:hypothetical protein